MPVLTCTVLVSVIRKRTEYENVDNDIREDDGHAEVDEGEICRKTSSIFLTAQIFPSIIRAHRSSRLMVVDLVCVLRLCVNRERRSYAARAGGGGESRDGSQSAATSAGGCLSVCLAVLLAPSVKTSSGSLCPPSSFACLRFTPVYHMPYTHSAIHQNIDSLITPAHFHIHLFPLYPHLSVNLLSW